MEGAVEELVQLIRDGAAGASDAIPGLAAEVVATGWLFAVTGGILLVIAILGVVGVVVHSRKWNACPFDDYAAKKRHEGQVFCYALAVVLGMIIGTAMLGPGLSRIVAPQVYLLRIAASLG